MSSPPVVGRRPDNAAGARVAISAILALIAIAAAWQIAYQSRAGSPSHYDYDEGVYAATAAAGGDRLYRDVFLSQPPVLVLTLRAAFRAFGTSLATARAVSIAAAAVWVAAMALMLRARRCPWGAPAAICLLIAHPAFLAQSHTVEMEVPSEGLACAALCLAAWGTRRPESWWWVAAGALAALAMMTKLTALAAAVPLLALMLDRQRSTRGKRAAAMTAGGAAVAVALLPIVATPGFVDQVFTFHFDLARAAVRISDGAQSHTAHLASIARFLLQGWPLTAAAGVGAVCVLRGRSRTEWSLLAWGAAEVAILTALTPLWEHHLVILLSPLVLLAGVGLERMALTVSRLRSPAARVAVAAAIAVGILASIARGVVAAVPTPTPPELQRTVQNLAGGVSAGGSVLTDDPMVAFLAHRPIARGLIDTSLARIWTGQISEAVLSAALRQDETEAVVLWRGTFRQYFPALWSSAASAFPRAIAVPGGRLLLLKRARTAHRP